MKRLKNILSILALGALLVGCGANMPISSLGGGLGDGFDYPDGGQGAVPGHDEVSDGDVDPGTTDEGEEPFINELDGNFPDPDDPDDPEPFEDSLTLDIDG